jgi:prephenate dehydrogenase
MKALEGKKIAIFGGASGWGSKISRTVEPLVKEVLIVDPKLGSDSADLIQAAQNADILFFSVSPDTVINEIFAKIREVLHPGQSAIDNATAKSETADTLKAMDGQGISVCSTHPMCRSDLPTRGQNALIMPVGKNFESAMQQAVAIHEALEMKICRVDFESHADLSAFVQETPHAMNRAVIHALAESLRSSGFTIEDLTRLGTANMIAHTLGIGRVAIQKTDISAKVISEGMKTRSGQIILQKAIEALQKMQTASASELEQMFDRDIEIVDPDKEWRDSSLRKTNVVLSRLGNLQKESFTVISRVNKPGVLLEILKVLHRHGIDLTAVDSSTENTEPECDNEVKFDMGIKVENPDWAKLETDLKRIGCTLANRIIAHCESKSV